MALLFVARQTGAVTAANASEWKETMALSKKPITGMKDMGLGLALCDQIAAVHNGRMEIESQVGKGTKISIVLDS